MQIDSTFSVVAPIDTVWETIMDFERVAGCVPGASILNKLSDDAYQVGMTVKLGPVNMQYKGLLNVLERNAAEHRAVLGGKAQETRGQGTAEATVTLQLAEEAGGTTRGNVTADLKLSGKAAAMGKGVIGSVTEQMMALFASNLQAMITGAGTAGGPEAGVPEPVPAAEAAAAKAAAVTATAPASELPGVPAGTVPAAPSRVSAPAPAGSLDALSLAKGIAAEQLSSPGKVLALVAVVACVSYWAGRCSAFRLVRAIGRMKTDRA
jgi:carbon monoxide dehydrogenase subunit G